MRCGDRKPAWWARHAIVGVLLATVGLVELYVEAGLPRQLLEVVSVVTGFVLIRL
jgi:hypothetical protein